MGTGKCCQFVVGASKCWRFGVGTSIGCHLGVQYQRWLPGGVDTPTRSLWRLVCRSHYTIFSRCFESQARESMGPSHSYKLLRWLGEEDHLPSLLTSCSQGREGHLLSLHRFNAFSCSSPRQSCMVRVWCAHTVIFKKTLWWEAFRCSLKRRQIFFKVGVKAEKFQPAGLLWRYCYCPVFTQVVCHPVLINLPLPSHIHPQEKNTPPICLERSILHGVYWRQLGGRGRGVATTVVRGVCGAASLPPVCWAVIWPEEVVNKGL